MRRHRTTIYVAEDTEPSRVESLRALGLDLVIHGKGARDAEKEARRVAEADDEVAMGWTLRRSVGMSLLYSAAGRSSLS